MITITNTAVQEILRKQNSLNQKNTYFRIGVMEGGCSGLIYTFDLETDKLENDLLFEQEELSILVDQETFPKIENLKLDFSEDLMGGGFRFQNPLAQKTCNCGQSFAMNT